MPFNDKASTILVVDDQAENIDILGSVLENKKYNVAVAMNGENAIDTAKKIKPDLILLDVSMPEMDGFSVCKILKGDPLTAGIPIIFLTASMETDDIVTGLSLGAVDYITKPFKSAELLMRIQTHLTIKCLQSELEKSNETLERKVEERTSELLAAKEKAESSDRLKSEFLSQISHEIRTPLNAVMSSAGLIESEMQDKIEEYLRPLFGNLRKGSQRIIRTVDLILNMAQVHTKSYNASIEKLDLIEILSLTAEKYKPIAFEKHLQFSVEMSSSPAPIKGDYYAIIEIVEQLLDNAVNYTNLGFVKMYLTADENKYYVTVEDSGVGMNPEFQVHLFNIFSQEEGGYARKFEGNGLGLALAKKFCDMNNITISFESEKNKGSKFKLVFEKYR